MIFQKYFTPQEANKRLPYVKKIVAEIIQNGQQLRRLIEERGGEAPPECAVLQEEIEGLIHELEQLGCYYKDWNFQVGLVDFPALIDEKPVFLCWRSDEATLRWYHGIDDGYTGRKLIPENLL